MAAWYHTVALESDGSVWAWGRNSFGQLGDDTIFDRHLPVQVGGLNGVIAVAAGGFHTVALNSDGSVSTLGYNAYGQLGDNTTSARPLPVQVSGLSPATICSVPICRTLCAAPLAPNGLVCDDGNACTTRDTCEEGLCVGSDPTPCPGDACNDGVCDPRTGECKKQQKNDGIACDDNNECTLIDVCRHGQCTGESSVDCSQLSCDPHVCNPSTGTCSCQRLALGDHCLTKGDCESGNCIDQVCCDSVCEGTCFACNLPDHLGQCTAEPMGIDMRQVCSDGRECFQTCSGPDDGTPRCVGAFKGSQCAPPRCTDDSHSLAAGVCIDRDQPCPTESTPTDCAPYLCNRANGTCFRQCNSVNDCTPPLVCDPSHECVRAPDKESGADCACSAPGSAAPAGGAATAALLALAAAAARRKRRP